MNKGTIEDFCKLAPLESRKRQAPGVDSGTGGVD